MNAKLKSNYVIIPLVTLVVAFVGSLFSSAGMTWYDTQLVQPSITPPKWAFPLAWTTIFILTAISALIVWNKGRKDKKFLWFKIGEKYTADFWWIIGLFITNAVLNVLWSLLFFTLHLITASFIEMMLLELTVVMLAVLIWKISKTASLLLLPYMLWVAVATNLTYLILAIN
jgi:tryptophan-rich sensory protein